MKGRTALPVEVPATCPQSPVLPDWRSNQYAPLGPARLGRLCGQVAGRSC